MNVKKGINMLDSNSYIAKDSQGRVVGVCLGNRHHKRHTIFWINHMTDKGMDTEQVIHKYAEQVYVELTSRKDIEFFNCHMRGMHSPATYLFEYK